MIDFRKTDEQELLLENLEEWVKNSDFNEAYFREHYEKSEYPVEYFKALFASPFGKVGLPEKFDGMEVDTLTLVMLQAKYAELGVPSPTVTMLGLDDLVAFGSEAQQKEAYEAILEGKVPFAMGLTEPQAGSDAQGYAATATRRNGKVYINGHKSFITNALECKYMLTITRNFDNGQPPAKAMTMWLVPLDAPGVKIEPMHKIGTRLGSMCEVYLEDVEIEESAMIGKEDNGFIQLMKNFEIERMLICATALGSAELAYKDAAAYAKQRIQFGKPIGQHQLIQEKLCRMAIKVESMRNMLYHAAWCRDNGESLRTIAPLLKLYCGQSTFEVADDAVQIMGGLGYVEECRVSRIWRDVRSTRLGGGTDEIMIHTAGKAILKGVQ